MHRFKSHVTYPESNTVRLQSGIFLPFLLKNSLTIIPGNILLYRGTGITQLSYMLQKISLDAIQDIVQPLLHSIRRR